MLVDKPPGPSSFAMVSALRRTTGARTGHAGTLDPFASGLLLLMSGLATRLAPCFVGLDKRYTTEIDLSACTSTGDPEGELGERHPAPTREALETMLAALCGVVELPIPAASAVKIGGVRAYRLARAGAAVTMPLRRSRVHALELVGLEGSVASLELHVESGTYVRAVATALGGHCLTLRRTAIGPFALAEADPERLLAPSLALARLPAEALARVPEAVRERVVGLEAAVAAPGPGS